MIYANNIALTIGRFGKDPKQEMTRNNKPYVRFSLGVDDGKDANGKRLTQWLEFRAYGSTAEYITKYCHKGDMIAVHGKNRRDTWKDDSNRTHAEQYVLAESVVKLTTSPKQPDTGTTAYNADNSRPEFDTGAYDAVTPDDLPW